MFYGSVNTFHVISIRTSSEDKKFQRDTRDYEQGAVAEEEEESVYQSDEEVKASGLSKIGPNSLVERLELLIPETKAGHDGLYDEMLNISKQLVSMNITNQEQRAIFVFKYEISIMVGKQQQKDTIKTKQQLLA